MRATLPAWLALSLSAAWFAHPPPCLAKGLPAEFSSACASNPVFVDRFAGHQLGDQWQIMDRPATQNSNRELETYSASAVVVEHGLHLVAARGATGAIRSGRVSTRASFLYGCFDVVAKLPAGRGLWGAIWLRTPYTDPLNGEIDIAEGFGSHPGVYQATLHPWVNGREQTAPCMRVGQIQASLFGLSKSCQWSPQLWLSTDLSATNHRYGIIWTPTLVTWFLDGHRIFSAGGGRNFAMNLTLDLAVGGVFDGNPDDGTRFPADLSITSVEAWPLQPAP